MLRDPPEIASRPTGWEVTDLANTPRHLQDTNKQKNHLLLLTQNSLMGM